MNSENCADDYLKKCVRLDDKRPVVRIFEEVDYEVFPKPENTRKGLKAGCDGRDCLVIALWMRLVRHPRLADQPHALRSTVAFNLGFKLCEAVFCNS